MPCGLNRRRWSGVALVVVVALLGSGTSWFAARAARTAEQRYAAQLMDRYTSDLSREITTQIQRYGDTLVDVSIALGSQTDLTADDFTWITNKISSRRLPGATSLGFVVSTPGNGIAAQQSYWRDRGAAGLTLQPSPTGDEHAFAVFTRSFDGSDVAAGTDLSATPEAAQTLQEAYAVKGLAVSRAHVLPRDQALPVAEQQLSFLFAVPVARIDGAFRGWLTMGVHGRDLLAETLRMQAHGAVAVDLDDPTDSVEQTIATSGRPADGYSPALDRIATVSAGLRTWELGVHPTE